MSSVMRTPGVELFGVDAQGAGVGAGVVVADEVQRATVTTGIAVDGHDAVERTLLGTRAGHSHFNGHISLLEDEGSFATFFCFCLFDTALLPATNAAISKPYTRKPPALDAKMPIEKSQS